MTGEGLFAQRPGDVLTILICGGLALFGAALAWAAWAERRESKADAQQHRIAAKEHDLGMHAVKDPDCHRCHTYLGCWLCVRGR